LKAGRWWRIQELALPYLAQRWMKLDDFNHELPSATDAGLHVWVEVVGYDGDVDEQLMTVDDGTGGDDAHAVDALRLRPFPGGRPDLIFGPKASDNRGFEKRQVGGWSHLGAVGQTVLPSDGSGVFV